MNTQYIYKREGSCLLHFFGQSLCFGYSLTDVSYHVEGNFREVIVFTCKQQNRCKKFTFMKTYLFIYLLQLNGGDYKNDWERKEKQP